MSLVPNTRLGPYEILAAIGAGGMGEVYRARDTRLGREVAIKTLSAEVANDAERVRRFELEARAVSALNHSNILTIHDIGSDHGVTYIVTELLRGESLRDVINRGPLPAEKVRSISQQIARGLAAAHNAGIVHRDLKPENLFITHDGVCKILDFGLARMDRPELAAGASASPTAVVTAAGTFVGTAGYMAPEQVRGHAADARADIFALGVVMREMLVGRSPFLRATVVESLNAILNEDPAGVMPANPLSSMVGRCLEKDPLRRFQSASDLAFAIENISGSGTAVEGRRPGRREWWIALPLVVAVLVFVFVFLRARDDPHGDVSAAPVRSLVVVPFASLSPESSDEYFSAGMTDALTTELSHIGALKVIGSHSASRFQDSTRSPADIAKELGVEAIVSGSVLRDGDRVRISARLSEAASDRVLWAENYERSVSNVLALQSEVTRSIAQAIALELSPAEEARLTAHGAVDPRALDEYLKGRFLWSQRTEPAVRQSLVHFQESARIAPDFALAHAGIADANLILAAYNYEQPSKVAPLALEALTRAMALDSTAGEPQATRGDFALHYERNYELSLRQADRAVALSPGYAAAHIWRGEVLAVLGRLDESIEELQRGIALDPMTPFPHFFIGYVREARGDAAQAERDYIAARKRFAGNTMGGYHARLLLRQKRTQDAVVLARELADQSPSPSNLGTLGVALALIGDRPGAAGILKRLQVMSAQGWASPLDIACVEAALGQRDAAIRHLREGIDARDFRVPFLTILRDVEFDSLASDPEYQQLMASIR